MTDTPKTPTAQQTAAKMHWDPEDVEWTKKPTTAQKLATRIKKKPGESKTS